MLRGECYSFSVCARAPQLLEDLAYSTISSRDQRGCPQTPCYALQRWLTDSSAPLRARADEDACEDSAAHWDGDDCFADQISVRRSRALFISQRCVVHHKQFIAEAMPW